MLEEAGEVSLCAVVGDDVAIVAGHQDVKAVDDVLVFELLQKNYFSSEKFIETFFSDFVEVDNFDGDSFIAAFVAS